MVGPKVPLNDEQQEAVWGTQEAVKVIPLAFSTVFLRKYMKHMGTHDNWKDYWELILGLMRTNHQ